MADGKLSNLIQITNQKIELLNSHLEEYEENQFYSLPTQNPKKEHIARMIHDLDYLVARSDAESEAIYAPYLEVRSKLLDVKSHISNKEEKNQSP